MADRRREEIWERLEVGSAVVDSISTAEQLRAYLKEAAAKIRERDRRISQLEKQLEEQREAANKTRYLYTYSFLPPNNIDITDDVTDSTNGRKRLAISAEPVRTLAECNIYRPTAISKQCE